LPKIFGDSSDLFLKYFVMNFETQAQRHRGRPREGSFTKTTKDPLNFSCIFIKEPSPGLPLCLGASVFQNSSRNVSKTVGAISENLQSSIIQD
jgi:hypothetical protein